MGCPEIIILAVLGCVLIGLFFFVIEAAVLAVGGIVAFGGIDFLLFRRHRSQDRCLRRAAGRDLLARRRLTTLAAASRGFDRSQRVPGLGRGYAELSDRRGAAEALAAAPYVYPYEVHDHRVAEVFA